jgi:3-hydroxyacyl-CoA dehydrogenase/3-hydroxy-2-methylbutyryl-CoA dehydrogenase
LILFRSHFSLDDVVNLNRKVDLSPKRSWKFCRVKEFILSFVRLGTMILSRTVAIVTGGSSGLGAATASFLVRNGGRVLVADLGHQHDNFLKMAETLGVTVDTTDPTLEGPGLVFAETDVTDPYMVEAALDMVERKFGEPVNAAINCAGIAVARKTLSKRGAHPLDEFAKTIMVNTVGSFNVARLAAERMGRREPEGRDGLRGCIINTASIAAFEGQIGQVAYAASKGGVVGMTLPMARDLAPYGIRVMTLVSDEVIPCMLCRNSNLPPC